MWTIITDEDIENADETIQNPNEGMPGMGGMFDAPGGDGNGPEDGESQKHDSSKSRENLHIKKCQKVLWMLQEKIREHGLQ